jgi:mRNA interferase RelE/StbE
MAYHVNISPAAARDIRSLPRSMQERVIRGITALAEMPRPRGCSKLAGEVDVYRIRVGDYRVLFQIADSIVTVLVIRVRHRREVYRSPAA